jgi:hypothetical protein
VLPFYLSLRFWFHPGFFFSDLVVSPSGLQKIISEFLELVGIAVFALGLLFLAV